MYYVACLHVGITYGRTCVMHVCMYACMHLDLSTFIEMIHCVGGLLLGKSCSLKLEHTTTPKQ